MTHLNKTEEREQACILEEAVVVQLAEAERPKTMPNSPMGLQMGEEEAAGDPCRLPRQPPQGRQVASLQGFTFVMSDNSYMML